MLRRAAPGAIVAALALLAGRPVLASLAAAAGVVVVALSLLAPELAGRGDRALGRAAHAVGVALGALLFGGVWVLLVLPTGVLLRLLRWSPLERGAPGWCTVAPTGHLPRRTYQRELRPRGVRRLHGSAAAVATSAALLVVALLAANLVARTTGLGNEVLAELDDRTDLAHPIDALLDRTPPTDGGGDGEPIAPINLLAHQGDPWAPAMFAELDQQIFIYDPVLVFRTADLEGEHVNVHDSVRASYQTQVEGEPVRVWFFGGSAMWGWGQRDEHTIASEVVRLAEGDGIAVEATNLGQSAYTSWQSLGMLERALTERPAPDAVVFYDGSNELATMAWGSSPVEPTTMFHEEVESALAGLFGPRRREPLPDPIERVEATMAEHRRPIDLARALSTAYGAEFLHAFQPSLYSLALTPAEDPVLDFIQQDHDDHAELAAVVDAARELLDPRTLDLSEALDDVERPVVYDWVHTNEDGARAVAEDLYAALGPALAEGQQG